MRSNGDYRRAPQVKTAAVVQLRAAGFDPVLAFDDDARNVAAYDRLGVPCVYIHSGYHPPTEPCASWHVADRTG